MNSPAAARAERRRLELQQEIADAAGDMFAEKGYHATTMADIAARAGVGTGTLYRSFDNKAAILDYSVGQLLERIMGGLTRENAVGADTLASYREQVERIGDRLADAFTADPRLSAVILQNIGNPDPDMTRTIGSLVDAAATLTSMYIQHGIDAGYLRDDVDAEQTARLINGIAMAAIVEEQRSPGSGKTFIPAGISLMFDGIAKAGRK